MRTLVLTLACAFMTAPAAHAWAMLLGQPELQYPVKATKADIITAETAMNKLRFESGIVHVSAPTPSRNLRFGAPGQSINGLVRQLQKLGFTVTISLSDSLPIKWGFAINQPEDGSNTLRLLVNTKHPDFDRTKLTVPVTPDPPKRNTNPE